jgi:hypothetical protein|nr:MAG TPA: hypothetical protein [Caudoviricetes sp.]
MTGFQTKNEVKDGKRSYKIEFYTDNKDYYEMVQKCCRDCIDDSNRKIEELRRKAKEVALSEPAGAKEAEEAGEDGQD